LSDSLASAALIPYASDGETLKKDDAIALDFNPETLTIKVTAGQQSDRTRRGNQQVQHVGTANADLSFDAIFDTTRPTSLPGEDASPTDDPERLDVRHKTAAIANLLQVEDQTDKPAPRRVQFSWGTIEFNGLIKSFNEVIDYFSPAGVPLRSKVSITITEQEFRYEVDSNAVASQAQSPSTDNANALAGANGLDSLFDLSVGAGFSFDASLDLDIGLDVGLDVDVGLGVDLGVDVDLGFDASAGIELNADTSLEVFGGAALESSLGGDVDLGVSLGSSGSSAGSGVDSTSVETAPTTWAPDGPVPGSRAAALAGEVQQVRAAGQADEQVSSADGQFTATSLTGETRSASSPQDVASLEAEEAADAVGSVDASNTSASAPTPEPRKQLPILGSPPMVPSAFVSPAPAPVFGGRDDERTPAAARSRQPSWEQLPDTDGSSPTARGRGGRARSSKSCGCASCGGCGCRRCSS